MKFLINLMVNHPSVWSYGSGLNYYFFLLASLWLANNFYSNNSHRSPFIHLMCKTAGDGQIVPRFFFVVRGLRAFCRQRTISKHFSGTSFCWRCCFAGTPKKEGKTDRRRTSSAPSFQHSGLGLGGLFVLYFKAWLLRNFSLQLRLRTCPHGNSKHNNGEERLSEFLRL